MTTPQTTTNTNVMSSGAAPSRATARPAVGRQVRRLSTETKASWKTTEFWIYIAVVVGILIGSQTVGSDSGAANGDYFRADQAWLYIVLVTIGYLLSRGLAKSGSRDFYDDTPDNDSN
jgi:hypothetical protein